MNIVALEFANGRALYYGIAVVLAALAWRMRVTHKVGRPALRLAAIAGGVLVIMSATPVPVCAYGAWAALFLASLILQEKAKRWAWPSFGALAAVSAAIGAIEFPHHLTPDLPAMGGRRVYVIGDSISVAWETGTGTWADVLRKRHGLDIVNLAEPGVTAKWAMDQSKKIPAGPAYVILEIGGNDLLGDFAADDFENSLDQLLASLAGPQRTLVMLELPLPPLHQRYGRIQRRLAAKHGVTLIPKRYFASVFGASGATSDGLHLTPSGQVRMAEVLWEVLGPARS